jgi:phage tail sheath protein FI
MAYNVGVNLVQGQASNPIDGVTTAIGAIVGNFERGPLDKATLVTSMGQFERIFGSVPQVGTTGYYSVKGYFKAVGSGQLYIIRASGDAAAKATYTFEDRLGTPANTLIITAKSEGAHGNNLSVAILDNSIVLTTPAVTIAAAATDATLVTVAGLEVGSDLKLYNGTNTEYVRLIQVDVPNKKVYWTGGITNEYTTVLGVITSMEFTIAVYDRGVLVETVTGLSMNDAVSFFCEKQAFTYITVTDAKATDTDYQDLPAVIAATPLASGDDGVSDVDVDSYTGSQVDKTGLYAMDEVSDVFRFCCPNPLLTDADPAAAYITLVQACIDYANSRGTVLYYGDTPFGATLAETNTFRGLFEGAILNFFWPWGSVLENSLTTYVPPSSVLIGMAAKKDFQRGIHKNLGNEKVPYFTGLEYYVSVGEGETLNDAGVNTLRLFRGEGIRTYGGRTCSAVTSWRFLHYIELWCFIGRSLERAMRDVIFEPNTPELWQKTVRRVTDFMLVQQSNGAVTEFMVKMDADNNPQDQIALGFAKIELEYVPAGTVEKLIVIVTSSPAGLSVSAA